MVELYTKCMLPILVIVLILLWALGYIHINGITIPDFILFTINGHSITLWNIITLLVVGWIIGLLPSPLREIVSVLLVLWILSLLGILFFGSLGSLLIIAIIVGVILSLTGLI